MRCRNGFTLIEVLVALIIGGIVIAGAHSILDALSRSARAAQLGAVNADQSANGDELLRSLTGRLDVATPGAKPFFGSEWITAFSSWCEVPRGWLESCSVVLAFDTAFGKTALVARVNDSTRVVLLHGFTSGSFRYLESAANGGVWQRLWGRGVSAPSAIGVVIDRDTLIIPVGERG